MALAKLQQNFRLGQNDSKKQECFTFKNNHTQSHTVSPLHFFPAEYFVVSCPDEEYDGSVDNTELRPAGRRSHGP